MSLLNVVFVIAFERCAPLLYFKMKFSICKLRNITHLLNSEHNHHAYGKAHDMTYSFRELTRRRSLSCGNHSHASRNAFAFSAIFWHCGWRLFTLSSIYFNSHLRIFEQIINLSMLSVLDNGYFRMCRASWIWYQRFLNTIPKWVHVFIHI